MSLPHILRRYAYKLLLPMMQQTWKTARKLARLTRRPASFE